MTTKQEIQERINQVQVIKRTLWVVAHLPAVERLLEGTLDQLEFALARIDDIEDRLRYIEAHNNIDPPKPR